MTLAHTLVNRAQGARCGRGSRPTSAGRRSRRLQLSLSVLAGLLITGATTRTEAEPIKVQGSTTVNSTIVEPFKSDIEAMSGVRLQVIANKSIHGLMALLEKRAEIAMISSDVGPEIELIQRKRADLPVARLVSHEIARTRIAFVVNPANAVRHLSFAQIADIMTGALGKWSDVGGADLDIVTVTTQPGGGVPSSLRAGLLEGRWLAPRRHVIIEASRKVINVVEQEAGAIGVVQLGHVGLGNVAELTTTSVIEQRLNLVTLGPPTPRIQAVIDAFRTIAAGL